MSATQEMREMVRLKFAATINDEALTEDTPVDWEMRYVDIGNVNSGGEIEGMYTIAFANAPSRARRIARNGDVIVSTVRTYLQAIASIEDAPENLIVSTGFAVVRAVEGELLPRFAKYCLREKAFLAEIEMRSVGISYPAINASELGDICISKPSLENQQVIADYLDRETARIDTLIAAKERLLRLLAEKRQALITAAVTRGIVDGVAMRESGVEWLGEVPGHWEVVRLKFHLDGIEQGWSPQCDNVRAEDGEWGVLKAGCVNGWEFNERENKRLPDYLEPIHHYEVRPGDVLMSRANTRELLGSASIVGRVRPQLLLCDKLYRLIVDESGLLKSYLLLFVRSKPGRYEFERDATGASQSMQNIGQDSVVNLRVPIPPLQEQAAIVAYVEQQFARLAVLQSATLRTIALLKERRAALITAAVTGQLSIHN